LLLLTSLAAIGAAVFASIAALLWLGSTMAKAKADPASTDFRIVDNGVDVLETAKLQVRWNRWAAAAASVAAACQAVSTYLSFGNSN